MKIPFETSPVRRRTLLGGALGAAAVLGLSSCSSSSTTSSGAAATGNAAVLPTYRRIVPSVAADLPGTDVVQDVYFRYPSPQFTSVSHDLGKGGDLSAMIITYGPPPTPVATNEYWQQMNQRLNVTFKPDVVPSNDFPQKFSTVIGGGGELPNLIQVPVFMALPRLQQLIDNRFYDISSMVSGDAVLKYPNLANIPSYAWKMAINNGRVWGVPLVRPVFTNVFRYRQDISAAQGHPTVPATEEGFLEWAKAVTDTSKQRYALGNSFGLAWMLAETMSGMYEAPNGYTLEGGQLKQGLDHDSWWQYLEMLKKLWAAGVIHPDTPTMTAPQMTAALFNGTVVASEDGQASLQEVSKYPDATVATRPTYTKDGSKVHANKGAGVFSVMAIEKGQGSRAEELLNILDYLAAPYGSTEYTFTTFGIEGQQHTLVNGSPVLSQDRSADLGVNFKYVCAPPGVLYAADAKQQTVFRQLQETQKALATGLVENPVAGLKSDTLEKSGRYTNAIGDARNEYILGRKALSDVKAATDAFTKDVWPAVKKEFEEQLAARG